MSGYYVEFILSSYNSDAELIQRHLEAVAEKTMVFELPAQKDKGVRVFKIQLQTQEPTVIFDTCAQFGRIKSVKVEEGRRQWQRQS